MKWINRDLFFTKTFHILATLLYASLFLTSMFVTGTQDPLSEYIVLEYHSLFLLLLIVTVFGVVMFLSGLLYDKIFCKYNRNALLGIACIISLLFGLYWVNGCGTEPQADQLQVVVYADLFNNGDFSGLQKGHYLANCSHLLGLVTLMRKFFLIFGAGNYVAFQYFNAFMPPLIIFCSTQVLRKIFKNNSRAEFYYLFLMLTCFPMYAYTPFVYGELTSTAAALLAAWLFLSCLEKFSLPKIIGLALASGMAVQLRKNTLIILIAFGIVVIVSLLCKAKWKTLVTGVSILIGVIILQTAVNSIYRDVKNSKAESMPAILYVNMGLHDANNEHPGWYDNSNDVLFGKSGHNAKIAAQAAFENIKASLDHFQKDPNYAKYFFTTKMNSQWQTPMYQCIAMNRHIVREQPRLIQMIYQDEPLGKLIKLYMKAFQFFMYGSILFWLLSRRKDKLPIETYVLLIAVFGGFLFSIIWEAKTRYIFPYLLLMIPYFSMGIEELTKWRLRKQ